MSRFLTTEKLLNKLIVIFAFMLIFSETHAATIIYDETPNGDLGHPVTTLDDALVSGENIIKGHLFPNETTADGADGDFFKLNLLDGFNITNTKLTISELILVNGASNSGSFYYDNGTETNKTFFPDNGDYFPSFQDSLSGIYSVSRDSVTTQSFNWEWRVTVTEPKSVPEPNILTLLCITLFVVLGVNYRQKILNKEGGKHFFI